MPAHVTRLVIVTISELGGSGEHSSCARVHGRRPRRWKHSNHKCDANPTNDVKAAVTSKLAVRALHDRSHKCKHMFQA